MQAGSKLPELEARLSSVTESVNDAIVSADSAGRIIFWNRAAARMFGRDEDEVIGQPLTMLMPERYRAPHAAGLEQVRTTGKSRLVGEAPVELHALHADGHEFPIELSLGSWDSEEGRFYTGVIRDVTERVRARDYVGAQLAVAGALATTATVEEAAPEVLAAVAGATGWALAGLWLVDPGAGVLRCSAVWRSEAIRDDDFERLSQETVFVPGEGLPGRVWQSRAPLWLNDAVPDANFPRAWAAARNGLHGAIGLPIVSRGEVIGVIEFFCTRIREPEEGLQEMMATVGLQIGQFIERRRAEETVRNSEAQMAEAQALARLGSWEWDVRADAVTWSDQLYSIFGLERERFAATFAGYVERLHPDDRERVVAIVRAALENHQPFSFVERIVRPDGSVRVLASRGRVVCDSAGQPVRMVGVCQDITELRAARDAVRVAEDRFRNAFDHAPIGVALVGVEAPGRLMEVNASLAEISGHSQEALLTMTLDAITHPDDADSDRAEQQRLLAGEIPSYGVEKRCLHADGQVVWVMLSASLVRAASGRPLYRIVQLQDISARKRFEGQLQHLADHDPLTGLFNRRRFEQELSRQVAYTARFGGQGAVLVIDLDRFKYVNDTLGHAAGDELIRRTGEALRARLRETDTVARLGGDEFAVLLPLVDEAGALQVAEQLLAEIRQKAAMVSGGRVLRPTASVGVSLFSAEKKPMGEAVLVNADIAMYEAKEAGRDRVVLLRTPDEPRTQMRTRLTWSERLRAAIENDGFVLYEQPILNLESNTITRHELLLRMRGENGDVIPPATFLCVAEEFGMIQAIDRWVIHQAVALIAERERAGDPVTLEVNLSGASIVDPGVLEAVERELASRPIDPTSLIFEVTETAAIVNIDKAKRFAGRLAELGCAFALDDFGAGFGSFYYLKHLPFDYLKIDGDFIRKLPECRTDQLAVQAIVQVAKGLGKQTIAEFVENEAIVDRLRAYGVDFAQGYHIARPAPAQALSPTARVAGCAARL